VEAQNSTPTHDDPGQAASTDRPQIKMKDERQQSLPSLAEVWAREQRIEKALTILAPKVDAIMKALEEGKKRAEKMATQQQGLPPAPKGEKSKLPIPTELIAKGIGILEKAFTEPKPDSTHSMIEKKLIDKAINDVLTTVDNDRAVGAALRKHITKHGMKGIIKFGETE